MSQALQSLNSILKYKNERERQKIDRSLSVMDMATRLKQQKIDNSRQERMMQLREADARRDIKESAARLTNFNLEQKKLNKSLSEDKIEEENKIRELQVQKLQLEIETKNAELVDKNVGNIKASLDTNIRNKKQNLYNQSMSTIPGLENSVKASSLASQDFEEGEINTVIKSIGKYSKNNEEKKLLKYITKNHRDLIPAIAAIDIGGFKLAEDSIIDALSSLYKNVQTNKEFQKLFQDAGVNINSLNNNMINLSNIIREESIYDSYINSGEIEKQAKRLVKSQGLDTDSQLKMFGLNLLGMGNMSNDDIDALNEQRIKDGLDPIPYEEFK